MELVSYNKTSRDGPIREGEERGSLSLAIRLPAEIEKRLDDLAKATGGTKTFYAREAILGY